MCENNIVSHLAIASTRAERLVKSWMGRCLLTVLVLSSIGWLFSLPGLSGDHWRQTFVGSLAQWWSWGLMTPVIFWADRHLPFSDKQLAPPILAHLLPSVFLTATYIYVFAAVRALLGMGSWSALLDTRILASALKGMFL
jgi:two-component system LytT family sensor kinase